MARQANCFAPLRESPFIIESISRKPYETLAAEDGGPFLKGKMDGSKNLAKFEHF
jgi:hypothetical protein